MYSRVPKLPRVRDCSYTGIIGSGKAYIKMCGQPAELAFHHSDRQLFKIFESLEVRSTHIYPPIIINTMLIYTPILINQSRS